MKRLYALALGATIFAVAAQDINTEITVDHEVVPEEQAVTRLRILPAVNLPAVNIGRLPMASRFVQTPISPFFNPLSPVGYLSQAQQYPFRGYAQLGYGPIYNLTGSAGYRLVETKSLTTDAFLQFNGFTYKRGYTNLPAFMGDYRDKVSFRRNGLTVGANTSWTSKVGTLKGSVLYQYADYNYPILQLTVPAYTDHYQINANQARVNIGWTSKVQNFDYSVAADYSMIYLGKRGATNNRGEIRASGAYRPSSASVISLDLGYSLDHSAIVGNKGILHILPNYFMAVGDFKLNFGVDMDLKTGNSYATENFLIAPDLDLLWQPHSAFNAWAKVSGRMTDNYRGDLLNEQPYLLADFDAIISRIYDSEIGVTVGPFRGAGAQVFAGYTFAEDWYMPALETGYMTPINIRGFRWGASVKYDYRKLLSFNTRFEMAQSPDGNYSKGYAPWRDHAKINLVSNLTVRPIEPLDISLSYHMRSGRQKTLGEGKNLNLNAIHNLSATINYNLTRQWSVFLTGKNLANRNWYLGPAVPCQGITGIIGASYKF